MVNSTEYGSDFLLLTGNDRAWFKVEDKATNLALFKSRWKPTNLFVILTTTFITTWTPTFGRPIVKRFSVYSLFLNFSNFKLFIYSRKISLLSEWTSESPLMLSSDYICSKFNAELKWSQLLAKTHMLRMHYCELFIDAFEIQFLSLDGLFCQSFKESICLSQLLYLLLKDHPYHIQVNKGLNWSLQPPEIVYISLSFGRWINLAEGKNSHVFTFSIERKFKTELLWKT